MHEIDDRREKAEEPPGTAPDGGGAGAGAGAGAGEESYDDDYDELFDVIPAPPRAMRAAPRPAEPLAHAPPTPPNAELRKMSEPPNAAPRRMSEPPAPRRMSEPPKPSQSSPDRWAGGAIRAALRPPEIKEDKTKVEEAAPTPRNTSTSPASDGSSAFLIDEVKGPATWRSKSKPPLPFDDPATAFSEPHTPMPLRTPMPRAPAASGGADSDSEVAWDIAPIGPTETASARAPSPITEPRRATPPPAMSPGAAGPPSADEITNQIHALEARLDSLIRQSRESRGAADLPPSGKGPERAREAPRPTDDEPENVTARELFSTDFYLRQWGRIGMKNRSEEVDEFGLDPKYEARYKPFFDFLYSHYFRVDTQGTENIPSEGRCLIVSNHSGGTLPYDGIMLRAALRHEHPSARELRWLAEDFIYHLPFVGAAMNRLGAVRACQENAERLLEQGRLVAVFPEGAKGIGKLYRERYRLQRFGRGGFIRLCLRTRTPLVPCAIIGAEEANPMLYRIETMTKALGIPYLPVTPTFPALGPLGLLPAPTKWKIRFDAPIRFDEYGPEAADDEILVGKLAERVRATIQSTLDKALSARRSIWFG